MKYKQFKDIKLSAMAMGTMRLPLSGEALEMIDEKEIQRMVDYAITHGINYFDTAYGYHNGRSEVVIGKSLKKYPRESFYLADKFPGYDLSNMDKVDEIFQEQLKRCNVEFFDFYMFHNVYEKNVGPYLNPEYGIMEYLLEQKRTGRIKHLGFSAHGTLEVMGKFLDVYGSEMEFCQIQLNYIDWDFQNAKEKVELLNKWGLPIWVMEPLRGGRLAKLSEDEAEKLKSVSCGMKPVQGALNFIESIEGITLCLSGVSSLGQLKENIEIYECLNELDQNTFDGMIDLGKVMVKDDILPCTGCNYCAAHCPQQLDIPRLISLYNEHNFTGGGFLAPMAVDALDENKRPDSCLGCGNCEAVCPQELKIAKAMVDFQKMLDNES